MKQLNKIYFYFKREPSPNIPLYIIKQYHTVYANITFPMNELKENVIGKYSI